MYISKFSLFIFILYMMVYSLLASSQTSNMLTIGAQRDVFIYQDIDTTAKMTLEPGTYSLIASGEVLFGNSDNLKSRSVFYLFAGGQDQGWIAGALTSGVPETLEVVGEPGFIMFFHIDQNKDDNSGSIDISVQNAVNGTLLAKLSVSAVHDIIVYQDIDTTAKKVIEPGIYTLMSEGEVSFGSSNNLRSKSVFYQIIGGQAQGWVDGALISGNPQTIEIIGETAYLIFFLIDQNTEDNSGQISVEIDRLTTTEWYEFNEREYCILLDPMTWQEAEQKAIELSAHLVTINDAEENKWLSNRMLSLTTMDRIWIGLNDIQVEGQYVWISGEDSDYRNWAPNEPNPNYAVDQDCVQILNYATYVGQWDDFQCTGFGTFPAIIERPISDTAIDEWQYHK